MSYSFLVCLFFEMGFLYSALAIVELTMKTGVKLTRDLPASTLSAGIKVVNHCAWPFFFISGTSILLLRMKYHRFCFNHSLSVQLSTVHFSKVKPKSHQITPLSKKGQQVQDRHSSAVTYVMLT